MLDWVDEPAPPSRAEADAYGRGISLEQFTGQAARGEHPAWCLASITAIVLREFRSTEEARLTEGQVERITRELPFVHLYALKDVTERRSARMALAAGMPALAFLVRYWGADTASRASHPASYVHERVLEVQVLIHVVEASEKRRLLRELRKTAKVASIAPPAMSIARAA